MLSELAAAVRGGEVAPRELVERALARIEAAKDLNAVIALRAEDALAEADGAPTDGPLAGLPLLVKDLARCTGMRTTLGSPLYADAPLDTFDDVVVARLNAAGAIVVGKTNAPQFGHTAVTTNPLFGATRNPWNPERSPGGSSGGSGAALVAGLTPLATSSDGGGSVRIPASACGLVGYKPTNGAFGRNVIPRWYDFSTMGCTGASVADVVAEASVVLGPVAGDRLSVPRDAVRVAPTMPTRVVACRTLRTAIDPVIGTAFDEVCGVLADDLSLAVEEADSVTGVGFAATWFVLAAAELAQSLAEHRASWDDWEDSLRTQVQFGGAVTTFDYIAAQRERYAACLAVDEAVGEDGVLVTPTVNAPSWPAEGPLPGPFAGTDDPFAVFNTADFNATGHPAVSVPLGTDEAGVPFGLQVVAPRHRDDLALGLAEALEQARPWPRTAPGFEPFWP